MRSLAALLPFPKIMKIFNIPFPQRQILRILPHRRPPVPPCSTASEPPPTHSSPHRRPPVAPQSTRRTVLRTSPGVPFSAPPVTKSPLNLAQCPVFRPTCHEIPVEPRPVSRFPPHLSRNPPPTSPSVPFSAPPVPFQPDFRARWCSFRDTWNDSVGVPRQVVSI